MKFTTLFAGVFAAVAVAAPTTSEPEVSAAVEKRTAIPVGQLNNLNLKQQDLRYLLGVNKVDLALFQQLGLQNNFNLLQFQNLFNVQTFDINSLLQFQQLHTLLAIAQTGVLNKFDLSSLVLGNINLALIQPIGGVNLGQFIDVAIVPQVQTIANGVATTIIIQ